MSLWAHIEEDLLDHSRRFVGIGAFILATLAVQFVVGLVPDLKIADVLPAKDVIAIAELAGVVAFVFAELCSTFHFIRRCCGS